MRAFFCLAFIILCGLPARSQESEKVAAIILFREALNRQYADPEKSPLKEEDRLQFSSHDFYPVDTSFTVSARFVRTPGQKPFEMVTTTSRRPVYEKYGEAHFFLGDSAVILNLYQSHSAREKEAYAHLLFVPFTDLTNGFGSYGGGRYMDVEIPEGDTVVIDFNQSYNPYCCYNPKYSCPIPPKENFINYRVTAGIRVIEGH